MLPFVSYRIARETPLPPIGASMYEYVLAGNGLFVRGQREGLRARDLSSHVVDHGGLFTSIQTQGPLLVSDTRPAGRRSGASNISDLTFRSPASFRPPDRATPRRRFPSGGTAICAGCQRHGPVGRSAAD